MKQRTLGGLPLIQDPDVLAGAERDHGNLTSGRAIGVVRPATADDVASVVRDARSRGLRLTPRGLGHSGGGQAVAWDSVVLDLTRVRWVEPVAGNSIRCAAGATWRDVTTGAARAGMTPLALPTYLDLTVGGTLSVGGVGTSSGRHGLAVAQVDAVEVVTSSGEHQTCTPRDDLFHAVLGGMGRCGVITAATLRLGPLSPWMVTTRTSAASLDDWLSAIAALRRDAAWEHVDATTQWVDGAMVHEVATTVSSDRPGEPTARSSSMPGTDFAARFDHRFADSHLRSDDVLAPVVECFLERSAAVDVARAVAPSLPEECLLRCIPIASENAPRSVALPPGDVHCLAVLTTGFAERARDRVVPYLRRISDLALDAGGTRYLAGWLSGLSPQDWRTHFGPRWHSWIDMKEQHDPAGVFASRLFPPGPEPARDDPTPPRRRP